MKHNFSIMNLDEKHIDEICEDIRNQYESGVSACPLFCMTLVPEGNPVVDKAAKFCAVYKKFKEKLDAMGVPNGVLVQASIGHGWKLSDMFPYQQYIGIANGEAENTVCPYDEGFREYIRKAFITIASCRPDHIMVDDDFRLIAKAGGGCGCPLHIKRFNEIAGTDFDREEVLATLLEEDCDGRHQKIFVETQRESLVETAKIMRDAIDEIDPSIPGSFCAVSVNAEFGAEIAKILAGEGNPVVLRINNGHYTAPSNHKFTEAFFRAATQIAKIRESTDIILAETDTCPQNRYSTSALSLHTHFTGSILEGVAGAKHWITRLHNYEPKSGLAYRRILSKHNGFYSALSELVPQVKWSGLRMPVLGKPVYRIGTPDNFGDEAYTAWGSCVFERLALPMFFSHKNEGILCLDGKVRLSDDDLLEALHGTILLSSISAEILIKRGFGEYLGISVREWEGKSFTGEYLTNEDSVIRYQMKAKELVITDPAVKVDSYMCNTLHGNEHLFPACVVYKNKLGGTVITFAGSPRTNYNHVEAFSFLNETRKRQLVRLLFDSGEIKAYYPGDEELYFRCGSLPDGRRILVLTNLGHDPIDEVELFMSEKASSITKLMPDGSEAEIDFTCDKNTYHLSTNCNMLEPLVLFVK